MMTATMAMKSATGGALDEEEGEGWAISLGIFWEVNSPAGAVSMIAEEIGDAFIRKAKPPRLLAGLRPTQGQRKCAERRGRCQRMGRAFREQDLFGGKIADHVAREGGGIRFFSPHP
jgi:hypothetical protein